MASRTSVAANTAKARRIDAVEKNFMLNVESGVRSRRSIKDVKGECCRSVLQSYGINVQVRKEPTPEEREIARQRLVDYRRKVMKGAKS